MKQKRNAFGRRMAALCLTAGLLISGAGLSASAANNRAPEVVVEQVHFAYMIGYPEGHFGPNNTVSRAEVATVFFRMMEDTAREKYWTKKNNYSDVTINQWHNNAISVMSNMGILSGFADGTFRPDEPMTRGQVASVFAKFADETQVKPGSDALSFTDTQGHWAENAIAITATAGWMRGYAEGSFCPNDTITRAEFVTACNRLLERVPENEDALLPSRITWSDVPAEAWYYLAVCEATNSHEYVETDTLVPGANFYYEKWTWLVPAYGWGPLPEKEWTAGNEGDGTSSEGVGKP